jgi:hypothetical protein
VILTESSDLFKSREPGKLPFPKATTFNYVGYLVKDEDCERIGIVCLTLAQNLLMKSGAVERAWNQELLKELAARTGSSWKVQTF